MVIKTCCGEPLVDMDSTVIEKLKARYPDYETVDVPEGLYRSERRIRLKPGGGKYFWHIEVDVPPGCYVVWTRVCHWGNEETNKVMVIVGCGGEACVNLLLDAVETCSNQLLHPFLARAVELGLPRQEVGIAAKVLLAVADKPKKEFVAELGQRLEEVAEMKDPGLQRALSKIMGIVKPQMR